VSRWGQRSAEPLLAAGGASDRFVNRLANTTNPKTTTSTPTTAMIACLSRTDVSLLVAERLPDVS